MRKAFAIITTLAAFTLSSPALTIPQCASEGEVTGTCIWNAQSQGNGVGHSFVLHSDGSLTYLN